MGVGCGVWGSVVFYGRHSARMCMRGIRGVSVIINAAVLPGFCHVSFLSVRARARARTRARVAVLIDV